MKNQNIKTLEGALHRLKINFSGNVDFNDYEVYGSCSSYGCSQCVHFEVTEKREDGCTVIIPALRCGIYKYQLFIKQISSNQEYLILSGDITAKDRICDCGDAVNDSAQTVIDAAISADTVQVEVTIEKGPKGDKGDTGERGEDGKFEDLTEEQKQEIISPVSEQIATLSETVSEQGEKIEDIEETVDKIKLELSDVISQDYFTDSRTIQSVVAWRVKIKHSGSLLKFDNFKLSTYATDNWARKGLITIYSSNGETLRTGETVVFYGFKASNNNLENGILLLNPLEVNEGEVLEIKFYICSATGVLYGTTDEEYSPMNMEVNRSADDGEYCTVRNARAIEQYNGTPYISLIIEGTPAILRNLEERVEILEENADSGEGASIDWLSAQPLNENRMGAAVAAENSIAIGYEAYTPDDTSISIGNFAGMSAKHSFDATEGLDYNSSITIGGGANAFGAQGIVLGVGSTINDDFDIGIGNITSVSGGGCSIALGHQAKVNGNNTISIGFKNNEEIGSYEKGCNNSVSIGSFTVCQGDYNVSVGRQANIYSDECVCIGYQSEIYSQSSNTVVIGKGAAAYSYANYGVAIGNAASIGGENGIAIGAGASAMERGVAIGGYAYAPNRAIHIQGSNSGCSPNSGQIFFTTHDTNGSFFNLEFYPPYSDMSDEVSSKLYEKGGICFRTYNGDYYIPFDKLDAAVNGGGSGGGSDSGGSSTSSSMDWPALFAGDYYGYTDRFADANDTSQVFWSDRKEYLDAEGAWNYNLVNITESDPGFSYWYEEHTESYGNLRAFNSFMPNVPSLTNSFIQCLYLESWNCPTPQCSNFQYTFQNCSNLKHWRGDLSSLEYAYGMFGTYDDDCCQLDLASVQHIAQVINYGSWDTITLGVSSNLNGSSELEQAINEIYNKNWNVEVIYSSNG